MRFPIVALRAALVSGISLLLVNCASDDVYRPAPATYFMVDVRSGDTVSDIAHRYNVDEEDIIAINEIYDRNRLEAGREVRVPAYGWSDRRFARNPEARPARRSRSTPRAEPVRSEAKRSVAVPAPKPQPNKAVPVPRAKEKPVQRADSSARFLWPVEGKVVSHYGKTSGGERNDGINILTESGTPVRAAASGTVTYVGNELKSYGNLLLIRHDNGYVTAYAHNDRIVVSRGDRVARGEIVSYAGSTGDVEQAQVHFEIRQGTRPVDPKPYLIASN